MDQGTDRHRRGARREDCIGRRPSYCTTTPLSPLTGLSHGENVMRGSKTRYADGKRRSPLRDAVPPLIISDLARHGFFFAKSVAEDYGCGTPRAS